MRFILFLRYLLGYVVISLSGEFPERLMNILSKNKISFWNIKRKQNKIFLSISVNDFKKLKKLKKGLKINIKIIKKVGLNFIIKRYFKRIGIPIGISIFLLILCGLSMFIWKVEVVGNEKVNTEEIILNAREIGVEIGALKSDINSQLFREKMLLKNNKLAWCSFNIEGSKITINVSEISKHNDDAPSNIVSNYDGIITNIMVESGYANFKKGDAVKKGDILVAGTSKLNLNNQFVKSKANIIASVREVITVKGEFSGEKKARSGKIKKEYILDFFTIKIRFPLGRINGDFEEESHIKKLLILGKEMPIFMICKTYYQMEKYNFVINREDLLSNLEKEMEKKLSEISGEYEIITRNLEEKGNNLELKYEIKFSKNIGIEEKILFNTSN